VPTLNDVLAGSLAQAVQVQQIIDALKGTPNKGVPVALVSLNDANNYALTVQNDDPTNSRALSVLKSDGTALITADVNGVTLGAPINLPAGSLNGTQLADGSVTNVKLGPDVARNNLFVNGGFEFWQRGLTTFTITNVYTADRWFQVLSGTDTISTLATSASADAASHYALQATFTHGSGTNTAIYQQVEDYFQLKNRAVTASFRVWCDTASAVRVWAYQGGGGGRVYGTVHTGGSTWQTLTLTTTVDPAASAPPQFGVELNVSCIARLDNAMLVVGSQPANYVPMHPADDLARCQRYYEVIGPSGTGSVVISGITTAGAQPLRLTVRFARKAILPTVTKVGTWAVSNAGQPTVGGVDLESVQLTISCTAAGDTFAFNNAGTMYITVEANP
jgi:hypothetical protein